LRGGPEGNRKGDVKLGREKISAAQGREEGGKEGKRKMEMVWNSQSERKGK